MQFRRNIRKSSQCLFDAAGGETTSVVLIGALYTAVCELKVPPCCMQGLCVRVAWRDTALNADCACD
ncbi:hypothetical protein ILYODFUR_003961 [Ilyodon furcidens]|uniref:Uncharacterized protein n=1 Tax=Ilyodon furcidens TaxID=33524 RepID=A0ABV0USS3_9TELE